MKPQEIRAMSVTEMKLKLDELEESRINLEMQHTQKQLADPMKLRETRRDIARLKTILKLSDVPKGQATPAHKGQK
jgi:large subunit ribosomal protein L29